MQRIKTIFVFAFMTTILYGAYVVLYKPVPAPPAEVQSGAVANNLGPGVHFISVEVPSIPGLFAESEFEVKIRMLVPRDQKNMKHHLRKFICLFLSSPLLWHCGVE